MVGAGQAGDVAGGELAQVVGPLRALCGGQVGELGQRIARQIAVEVLVCEGRNVAVVAEAGLAHVPLGDLLGGRGCEQGTDIDGHVEDREGRIALGRVLRIVVEVADHHLEVALEETRTEGDEYQRAHHGSDAGSVIARGNGQEDVAEEHDDDARSHHLAVAELVGQVAAQHGQEVYQREESGEDVGCHRRRETELRLKEQGEDRQHGVVAETFARIGERQRIQTFGLSFKHNEVK